MKTIKIGLLVIASFALAISNYAQNSPQKLVFAKINLNHPNQILLDFDENLTVETWDENYIMATVSINTNVKNKRVLEQLIQNGRYLIKGYLNENNDLTIHAPNLKKIITVNQLHLEEDLVVKVFVPKEMKFEYLKEKAGEMLVARE